jgi:hypothetical protein
VTAAKAADPAPPPPTVSVKLAVNGRAVPGFPYRLVTFADDLTPDQARQLVEFYQRLVRPPAAQ